MFSVYIIQNKINHKVYVGKSNDTNTRWGVHKKVALGGREKYPNDFFAIHGSLAKYGFDNFTFQVIEQFDDEKECLEAEGFWIQFFRSWDRSFGYNLSLGGDGASPTEETRRKMSLAQQGEKHSHAILTDILVMEILDKYAIGNYTQRQLANEYGIHYGSLNDIIRNKTWTHLKRPVLSSRKTHSLEQKKKLFVRNGEATGNTKVTEGQAKQAISLYNTGEYTYKQIANIFGVTVPTICLIVTGKTWKYLER